MVARFVGVSPGEKMVARFVGVSPAEKDKMIECIWIDILV